MLVVAQISLGSKLLIFFFRFNIVMMINSFVIIIIVNNCSLGDNPSNIESVTISSTSKEDFYEKYPSVTQSI